MKYFQITIVAFLTFLGIFHCCKNKSQVNNEITNKVVSALFLQKGLAKPITIISRELSDGSMASCYKIVVKRIPTDHKMGPWCAYKISDNLSTGGIWMTNGKVYDVDSAFVKNLAAFTMLILG